MNEEVKKLQATWLKKAQDLEDKATKETVYGKKERDMFRMKAMTLRNCAMELGELTTKGY